MTSTKCSKFICAWDGTLFTGLIPGPADVVGATAHLLGHVEQKFSITGLVVSIIVSVAQTSSHIHAIIPPIHLHVVWRADAGVVADSVVTCSWTTDSRGFTFIHVITHSGIFVQVVTGWTAALETAKRVDTFPTLAQPWELLALVNVFQYNRDRIGPKTFSSRTKNFVLRCVHGRAQLTRSTPGFPQRTAAGSLGDTNSNLIATGCISVVSSRPNIQIAIPRAGINTANSSWVQLKVGGTITGIAAWGVDTVPTDACGWVQTLINICAVPATSVQFVADLALTTEQARKVVASSKNTDVRKGALINIFTGFPVCTGHKAHVTFTAVSSWGVQALAVATQIQVLRALIKICTSEAVTRVSFFTEAAIRAHGVLAVCMLAAHVCSIGAFIQIRALNAISNPSRAAATLEAPCRVGAYGMSVAVVCSDFTFVDVCTAGFSFFA